MKQTIPLFRQNPKVNQVVYIITKVDDENIFFPVLLFATVLYSCVSQVSFLFVTHVFLSYQSVWMSVMTHASHLEVLGSDKVQRPYVYVLRGNPQFLEWQ
jgi:hypothetical protein